MLNKVVSGLKEVGSPKGIGAGIGLFLLFALIAYLGGATWGTPERLAATVRTRVGG